MVSPRRSWIAPIYLFGCLILGGSAQGIWANMALQLTGVAIIAWAALARDDDKLSTCGWQLMALAIAGVALILVQMIPLPPAIWTQFGPRTRIGEGFQLLGVQVPPEPISLTPSSGFDSSLGIIPPLALICAMLRLKAYRPAWLAIAVITAMIASVLMGVLQVNSYTGAPPSPWYLFPDSNWGRAVGFFANADHMADLLVITIPFVAAIVASAKSVEMRRFSATVTVAAGIGLVLIVGIALNGSLAAYGLALPVICASAVLVLPPNNRVRLLAAFAALVLILASIVALETTAVGAGKLGQHASSATESRAALASTTTRAAIDFMPFGSGLGSFRSVYPLYESPDRVTDIIAVHAHNDYLELVLELGLIGLALIAAFLIWWVFAVWRAWRAPNSSPFARAATISSAAVLVHSAVDFPLRTAAIAAVFGLCLGFLADYHPVQARDASELRPSRHRRFG